MSNLSTKDRRAIGDIFRKEFDRIIGANHPKMRNIMWLVGKCKEMEEAQMELVERINTDVDKMEGMIKQVTSQQARISLYEKFLGKKELITEFNEYVTQLDTNYKEDEKPAKLLGEQNMPEQG